MKLRKNQSQSSNSNNIQDRFLLSSRASSSSLTPLSSRAVCVSFSPLWRSRQVGQWVAEQMDPTMSAIPSFRVAASNQSEKQQPYNEVQRQEAGEEGSGCGQMSATPSFPKARVLDVHRHTHTRTLTHTLHGLKGLPLCGRWINEGWEAEQWSYTMGGWGGQLQCEAWCYYGPGQQWRTPGYRAPQSLSSLCLELWGGWRWWWQEGFQLKEKLKAGWKTAVAFKRVQEEREECGCAEREKKTSVWGARDIKKFYVPVSMRRGPAQHCCGTLKADDSGAQIFAFLSFIWLCSTCRGSHLLKKSNMLQHPKWHKNLPTFSCTLV